MEPTTATSPPNVPPTHGATKLIADLDSLMQAVLKSLASSKPWQRQLLTHLSQADGRMQVLRMTIAMGRDQEEIAEAARQLQAALRAADAYIRPGRADMGTKASIHLAFGLGQQLAAAVVTGAQDDAREAPRDADRGSERQSGPPTNEAQP
jgi:hypothetical protein